MKEFIEFLIPEAHSLDPVDYEYVLDRQNRPTQRRTLGTLTGVPDRKIKSFLKKECYQDVKPPRVISTINGDDKNEYSRYIYAFTNEILKKQPWYAFGRTPAEVAERVAEVCMAAFTDVMNTDFSRWDGRHSNLLRQLESMALLRAFREMYHEELADLHRGQYKMDGFLEEVKYFLEYARASGSPETASFNGMDNAFVGYLHFRLDRESAPGLSPQAAWNALGLYGGDDGLTADVHPNNYERAAKMVGHKLTVERIPRGSFGVSFLARMYSPNVWEGDLNSCCDLPRQLGKFHATVSLPSSVKPTHKLLEKAFSFWLTDEFTPVIGCFVSRVRFLLNGELAHNPDCAGMASWLSQFPKEVQFPNVQADWMMEYATRVLPDMDYDRFADWLEGCSTLEDLLSPPCLQEASQPKPPEPVVIDGDIVPGPKGELLLPKPSCPKPECFMGCRCFRPQKKQARSERKKMTPEEFEAWKQAKILAGTWKER